MVDEGGDSTEEVEVVDFVDGIVFTQYQCVEVANQGSPRKWPEVFAFILRDSLLRELVQLAQTPEKKAG